MAADPLAPSSARSLVVNFNAPELHQLAHALALDDALAAYVRPYVNKGRAWERVLSAVPMAGRLYGSTFGRRRLAGPQLAALTREAGVLPDMLAATLGRLPGLDPATRHLWTNRLYMKVREAVARAACTDLSRADCVVAYEGFALPAFRAAKARGDCRTVLNYPVAHHRLRRRVRQEENEREPGFAATWPDFDDWPEGHEERLDEEIALADAVLVGSSYAADSFVVEGIHRSCMRVVPYGVDLQTFTPGTPQAHPERFTAIFAGQLTQRKGLSYLLRGYRKFARRDSLLRLVGSVVGSDAPLRPYADMVEHLSHQTRPALAQLYRRSHVFVFPSLIEGMPLVVLEAMACGLPVIVTANGPADIVRHGVDGFIVPERDEDAICQRLEQLYRDPELRIEMGQQAARRAKEFSWSAYAGKARGVLADLAGGTPAVPPRLAIA